MTLLQSAAAVGGAARRAITIRSDEAIAPGEVWQAAISPRWFVGGQTDLRVDLDPETKAFFSIERFAPMTVDDMIVYSRGQVRDRPGAYLRLRNQSAEARFVRGWAIVTPNVETVQHDLEQAAERAWSEGGEPDPRDAPQPDTFEADLARALARSQ